MRNIILIGMPGSGKTTFGKAIAERLGRPFIDADDYLEEKEGRTIASLFAISEDAFFLELLHFFDDFHGDEFRDVVAEPYFFGADGLHRKSQEKWPHLLP